MKRLFILSVAAFVPVLVSGVSASAAEAAEAAEAEAQTISIQGVTYSVVPDEKLRALGFEFPDVAPEENAALDYLKALETYSRVERGSELAPLYDSVLAGRWTADAGPLAAYLEKNKGTLALLEQAAAKPLCRFPGLLDEGKTLGEDAAVAELYLPYLANMREFARFLIVEGKAREFEGRHTEALEAYVLIFSIGDHAAQDPFLISGLLGVACNEMGIRAVERSVVREDVDEETLARAQKRAYELSQGRPGLAAAMRGERVFSTQGIEYAIKHPGWLEIAVEQEEKSEADLPAWVAKIQTKDGSEQARREIREFWDAMEEALALPIPEYLAKKDEFDAQWGEASDKSLVRMLVPSLWRARLAYARADLSWNVLDAILALARYKAKHGAYPEKLDDAKPLMLADGTDPFSGGPLHYRLEADGSFTIWSVGENLVDDGGEVGSQCPDWHGDDYVWNSRLLAEFPEQ
jgi:hypothetical protein